MSSPISFPDQTRKFSLPLLFSGQAQKEFSINQALSVIDAIVRCVVADSRATPPASPEEGAAYRILAGATGEWAGHDYEVAVRLGGGWHFIEPFEGFRVHDLSIGTSLYFGSSWEYAIEPSTPSGGATVDTEARSALSQLIAALRQIGILTSQN